MTDTNKMPHLYLDMDGVQADLFHRVAELENVEHWDDIPDQDEAITRLSEYYFKIQQFRLILCY